MTEGGDRAQQDDDHQQRRDRCAHGGPHRVQADGHAALWPVVDTLVVRAAVEQRLRHEPPLARRLEEIRAEQVDPAMHGVAMAWVTLGFLAFVLSLLALKPDTRLALCVMPLWFVGLAIAYQRTRGREQRAVTVL